MDKFDDQIKSAAEPTTPKPGFVENVMTDVTAAPKHGWFGWPVASAGLVAVAVIAVLALSPTHNAATNKLAGNATPAVSNDAGSGLASAGTDNATLAGDLSGVAQTVSQGASDLSSADTALSDQQPTINEN